MTPSNDSAARSRPLWSPVLFFAVLVTLSAAACRSDTRKPDSEENTLENARPAPTVVRPPWSGSLRMPDLPVSSHHLVKKAFDRFSGTARAGGSSFRELSSDCAAVLPMASRVLAEHGLPKTLAAIVIVGSRCSNDAESSRGRTGIWQLTPDVASAYQLEVVADFDERRNPKKSSLAAARVLDDLYRQLKDWELVLAAYHLGGSALSSSRLEAGADATLWELVERNSLPSDTADWVASVEAVALMMQNELIGQLQTVVEAGAPTAPLEVFPSTPIGLIARSALTSVQQIRAVNPELVADHIPIHLSKTRVEVHVPQTSLPRARELYELYFRDKYFPYDCVSGTFDWGRDTLTMKMLKECRVGMPRRPAPAPAVPCTGGVLCSP